MELSKIYTEEDLFPRETTSYERRSYGLLFYDEDNKDSFDSNHAIIYKKDVWDLQYVLNDIVSFYKAKEIKPMIYESISDTGYFEEIQFELSDLGFDICYETQKYMVLTERNTIKPNANIVVKRLSAWNDEFGTEIFEKADEPWEIDVTRKALNNKNTLFFVAYINGNPIGMARCHITDNVCRVDYLLVSKEYRNIGAGRTLIHSFTEYCNEQNIENCYLWPDGETAEKIYYEAGFRVIETKQVGRAVHAKGLKE